MGALGLPPGMWGLLRKSHTKEDYNWWQPYISAIPILCYIVLRNALRVFRNYHSAVFAWLGRCSLETYVLQYYLARGRYEGPTPTWLMGLWHRDRSVDSGLLLGQLAHSRSDTHLDKMDRRRHSRTSGTGPKDQ